MFIFLLPPRASFRRAGSVRLVLFCRNGRVMITVGGQEWNRDRRSLHGRVSMLALSVPGKKRLAYGLWRYREDEIDRAVEMLSLAREHRIDHLDTADVYGGPGGFGGSERLLGNVRRRAPELFDGAVLATKIGVEPGSPYNSSREYLTAACEASLSRLRVECIDLLYIHRPDLLTHPDDLARTLDGLVASGKVAAVGVSNFTTAEFDALSRFMKAPIRVHQLEFSAAHVEPLFDGTLDQAMAHGTAVAAWSPLAGGRFGGGEATPAIARVRDVLQTIAQRHGVSPAAAALAFVQSHPAPITPIIGTKNPQRLRDCLKANGCALSRAEWYAIVEACRGERMP
jgi:predicted oxidoreductase